jgi:PhnB protein
MRFNPYLTFNGDCEAAFRFYEQCFGGEVGGIFRYAGTPFASGVPPEWADKVMHATITICGQVLMGADAAPGQYEEPKGITLALHLEGAGDAERVFAALASGGRVVAPLERTFWAERFGVLIDRFGIPWLIQSEAPARAD